MKMPKLLDLAADDEDEEKSCAPPKIEKWRISSRDGRVSVTVRERALAADAKFNIRNCNPSNSSGKIKQMNRSLVKSVANQSYC